MIGSVLWEEMARGMPPQHLPRPLWTWIWTGCWARCPGRYVGGGRFLPLWPSPSDHRLPYTCFVTCVPSASPGAHTTVATCVAGVLPPEESPRAAAPGLAPRAERAPGPGTGLQAACGGQQALPHQQGPPRTLLRPLSPLRPSLCLPSPGDGCGSPPGPRGTWQGQGSYPDGLSPCCPPRVLLCSG